MEQQMNLNFNDIADAVKIIDYAAQQGAFKGWENIRQILLVRDKLQAFVDAAQATLQQNQAEAEKPEAPPAPSLAAKAKPSKKPEPAKRKAG